MRSRWPVIAAIALLVGGLATAWALLRPAGTHVDRDHGFSVACPPGWTVRTTDEDAGRRRVVLAPPREPSAAAARCTLLVEPTTREPGITQARLNELMTSGPMTALAWRSLLDEPETLRIVEARTSTLLGLPASHALVEGTTARDGVGFLVEERRWVTHTPGATWELTCRAERLPDAAPLVSDQRAIEGIVESLRLLPGGER